MDKLNMMIYITEAVSTNKLTYKYIDKIYDKNKIKYYNLAKENEGYNHPISRQGNIQQDYYYRKALGIFLGADTDEQMEELNMLFKKSFPYEFSYAQQNKIIDIEKFINALEKRHRGLQNIPDNDLINSILVVSFLAVSFDKEIIKNEMLDAIITSLFRRTEHYNKNHRLHYDVVSKERKRYVHEIKLKIKQRNNLVFDNLVFNNVIGSNMDLELNKMSNLNKYFMAFEYIYDFTEISLPVVIDSKKLSDTEINNLILTLSHLFPKYDLDIEEVEKYLYAAIQIYHLSKAYKEAKKFFFENNSEDLYTEINKKDAEIEQLTKDKLRLQEEVKSLQEELEKAQKGNKRLQQKVDASQVNKNELIALRQFIYNLNNESESTFNEAFKADFSHLNSLRGIIIGGHNNWQNKLKERLSTWQFISVDTLNFDERLIASSDAVVINTNYLSHGMYYKVINHVERLNKKLIYVNNNNIDICLNEISNQI